MAPEITWLGHAAVRIRLDDGTTVLIDPWLTGNPLCPEADRHPDRADAIYLTHGHFDHFGDTLDLCRRLHPTVFAQHEVCVYLGDTHGIGQIVGMNKGGAVEGPGGIVAHMVDAVHSSGISGDTGIISGGSAAGWVLELPEGPTVYHAGDTALFGDMALIGKLYQPDLAMLPIGGHYTMGPAHAARAAEMLEAPRVVPIHWGTFPALAGTPAELAAALGGMPIEVVEAVPGVPI